MSKSSIGWRKAGISSLATAALVAGACVAGAGAANATTDFSFGPRIAGLNRYETAVQAADQYGHANNVILADGEKGHFPDALVASYLAGIESAPILLTHNDTLPSDVKAEIKKLGATDVWIMGGTGVVSKSIEDELSSAGYTIHRVDGANRYETDAKAINDGGKADSNTAIVTTGKDFPDAVSASPLAYDQGMPLAITKPTAMDPQVVKALQDAGITKVIILGGPDVVGDTVQAQLKTAGIDTITRIYGTYHNKTSALLAQYEIDHYGFTNQAVDAASGYKPGTGADALSGGPVAGKQDRPMLVTQTADKAGSGVLSFLTDNANTEAKGDIFGDTGAVTQDAEDAMVAAARKVTTNQSYSVTPNGDTTVNTNAGGTTKVTISGISGSQVNLALIDCSQASTNKNGQVSFTDTTPADDKADLGPSTNATITEVNGVSSAYGTSAKNVDVQNGSVTVTVTSSAAGCSQLVAYQDKDNNNGLSLDSNNMPTDPFGITGEITAVTPTQVAFANTAPKTPYGSYTSTAQLENAKGDAVALAGLPVKFSRTLPDGSVQVSTVNTDANGQASITFSASDPNPSTSGDKTVETVTATPDLNQDGTFGGVKEPAEDTGSATQTVTFSDQAAAPSNVAVTSPAAGSYQAIGTPVTVTAKVTDQYGNPVAGQTVHFSSTTGYSADRTTGADGTASYTYKYQGTPTPDTVTAGFTAPGAQGGPTDTDSVTFHWSNGVATVNGQTYQTIADAIAAANNGDTITAAGTFAPASDIVVNKDVTVDGGGSATVNGGFQVAASGATIKGFVINVPANNQGVELQNGLSNVTVTGNTITGNGTSTSAPTSATGVAVNDTNGTLVSNNTISKVISGISTDSPSGSVSITGNTISSTSSEGIGVNGPNVAITGNTFKTEPTHVKLYMAEPNTYLPGVFASNTFDKAQLKDANGDGDYGDVNDAIVTPPTP